MLKRVFALYAWLICEILQQIDYDEVLAVKWHFLICEPMTMWEYGHEGFWHRAKSGWKLLRRGSRHA